MRNNLRIVSLCAEMKGSLVSLARVLIIKNENSPEIMNGQIDGYRQLIDTGEIAALDTVSHRISGTSTADQTFSAVLDRVHSGLHDVVVVFSPGEFPHTHEQFDQLEEALGNRLLLYWEGDVWGKHKPKPITKQMKWWFRRADIVFSSGGSSQAQLYLNAGARRVHHITQTYCHLRLADAEASAPSPISDVGVVIVGNHSQRIPYVTGLPGAVGRRELVKRLRRDQSLTLRLFGSGWPQGWSAGQIPYHRLADELRNGRVSANWDHFPRVPDSNSDRLPISLISGRPHVTTRHPGGEWLPGQETGLFQESSPRLVYERVRSLLDMNPAVTYQMGLSAHSWASHRVSDREGARYIMSQALDDVTPPPADPWGNLPGPWVLRDGRD